MKKNDKLHIPISTEHKIKLKEKAEEIGMTLSQYCLHILLTAKVKIVEDT